MKKLTIGNEHADPTFLLRHLLEIENMAIAESDIDHVLRTILQNAIDIYRAERGLVWLFDEAGETVFEASHNLSKEERRHPDFEISRRMIDQTQRQGEPICQGYACKDPSPVSAICLPLKDHRDVLGLIYLDHRTGCERCANTPCVFFREFADFMSRAMDHALEHIQPRTQVQIIEVELRKKYHFEAIVGHHPKIVEMLQLVAQVADTDATVLVQGESGTGKELIARALHDNSHRQDKPLISVNCGALPDHLLESELFGHIRGAFTGAIKGTAGLFESADGGTMFLDEVNDMSPALQVKLLRVLQTGEYTRVGSPEIRCCDVRVVAATSQDLQILVKDGKFREEVYYRLNIIDIWLPPLRDRQSDIPLLAHHFLQVYGAQYGKQHMRLSSEAEILLLTHGFPGHVRELENMMQRAVILAEGDTITPDHLSAHMSWGKDASGFNDPQLTFKAAKQQMVERFERGYLVDCLRVAKGNITHAAQSAGLHVTNFHAKMKKYHINPHTFKL